MSRRPQHKTRKQLRLETVSVQAELDQLKTPEGLANYLHSKRDDEEFQDAVSARIFELRNLERQEFQDAVSARIFELREEIAAEEATASVSSETATAVSQDAVVTP